jgi:hypothetical protein
LTALSFDSKLSPMGEFSRRRTALGTQRSAAVPLIWAALAERGWSDARLGAEMREDSAAVSRLLYGDRKANRQQATKLLDILGIPLASWDASCPVKRRKHEPRPPASTTKLAIEDTSLHAREAS